MEKNELKLSNNTEQLKLLTQLNEQMKKKQTELEKIIKEN